MYCKDCINSDVCAAPKQNIATDKRQICVYSTELACEKAEKRE